MRKKYTLFSRSVHFCAFFLLLCTVSCGNYHYQNVEFSALPVRNQIEIRKVNNFRFLGGIQNTEGKTLKDSMFYRSANLHQLKKKSFAEFSALGITTIIDLRTSHEIAEKPDQLPSGISYGQQAAFEDREDQLTQARKLVLKGKVTAKDAEKRMLEFYRDYPVEHPQVIRKIIHEIMDADAPVLYHCTAGKDRTGIITLLILKILKFDEETIMQEYLLSNDQRRHFIEKRLNLASRLHFLYPKMDIEVLGKLSWIERGYLNAALESVKANYGSEDRYIHEVLGISEEQRAEYIRKFMY